MPLNYPKIVVMGDSIAHGSFSPGGYGADLVTAYAGKFDVLNRGFPGYNSTQILKILRDEEWVESVGEIKLFILHIGTNDAISSGFQSVGVSGESRTKIHTHQSQTDIETFQSNLREIISIIHQRIPNLPIILISPAQCDPQICRQWDAAFGGPHYIRHSRDIERYRLFAEKAVEVADELGVRSINSFEIFEEEIKKGSSKTKLMYDGLHYTPAGYQPISNRIQSLISKHYPQLDSSKAPEAFPAFTKFGMEKDPDAIARATFFEKLVKDGDFIQRFMRMKQEALTSAGFV